MKDKFVSRIVLCRLGGIGDVIHTLPLVRFLRNKYKEASIEYITSGENVGLLINHCPFIDNVWSFDKKNKNELWKNILSKSGKIDYFFNLHTSFKFYLFNLLYLKAKKFFQYKKDRNIHAVLNFARTYDPGLSAFDLDTKTLFVKDLKDGLLKYDLRERGYACFVIGVGSARPHRSWPFEKWLSLAKKILFTEKDLKIVFLGGEYERKIFESWFNEKDDQKIPGFKDRAVNLTGKLTLSEVAEIVSKAAYLVSCDTGLLHLASALSVKVLGLFGPTMPERTGPFTADYQIVCAKECKCISTFWEVKKCEKSENLSGYCMNKIDVNDVLSKIYYSYEARINNETDVLSYN